jgi:hypothetical protein
MGFTELISQKVRVLTTIYVTSVYKTRWQYLGHTLRMSERIGETQVAPASLTLFLSTANLLGSLSNAVIDLWGVEYSTRQNNGNAFWIICTHPHITSVPVL